jgi:signal transduction histidine kinase
MPAFDQIYQNGPVIAIVRNPSEPWQVLSISDNIRKWGFSPPSGAFDLLALIPEDSADQVSRILGASVMQGRTSVLMRYRIRTGAGTHWVEDYCTLAYNEKRELSSAESLLWITSLPLEWHLLITGSEAWNSLNSKLRHDVLNQLTAILGYLELSSDMVEDPLLKDFTQKEQTAAEKIREKLVFSREYQKIGQTDFEWIRLEAVFSEITGEAGCKNLTVTLNIPEVKIFADKMLKQAFFSIFENIPEHAPAATTITVTLKKTDAGSILSIEDNGPGILEEHKTRIFDISFGKGQGHGLFLAEKLLNIFGITITENGKAGTGARFEMKIPEEILKYS